MRRMFWIVCVLPAILTLLASTRIAWRPRRQPGTGTRRESGAKPAIGLKRILFWNKYFRSANFQFGFGRRPFVENGCLVTACTSTDDRSTLPDADAVLFHGPRIESLPEVRYPDQLYVLVQKEPWLEISSQLMSAYRDVMNLTMTYRLDSDVVLPYAVVSRNASGVGITAVDPGSKSGSVAWAVSHCETDSGRELYVDELRKYVDVDVYGACGNLTCDKKHNKACWQMFDRKYRFILAMENDVCKDYVTEKAYRPLRFNIVPIVFGGADYEAVTPPHSVINIMDFPRPSDLAEYLKYLTRNGTAYNEYLAWKAEYSVVTYRKVVIGQSFCSLCQLLNSDSLRYKKYDDIREWWVDGACDRNVMTRLKRYW